MLLTPSGGAGGGVEPASVLSNLPEGSGPITAIVVAVCAVLAVAIPVVGSIITARSKSNTGAANPAGASVGRSSAEDIDRVSTGFERLEKELREARDDVKRIQARYEAEKEHSHDLEMQLAAAQQRLDRANDDLSDLRAQLDMVLRPLHADLYRESHRESYREPLREPRPMPPSTRRPPQRAWRNPDSDEAPTDPIRGARP